ncbi:hypothetical protein HispidOSU_025394 [Sigmodon hispidus]
MEQGGDGMVGTGQQQGLWGRKFQKPIGGGRTGAGDNKWVKNSLSSQDRPPLVPQSDNALLHHPLCQPSRLLMLTQPVHWIHPSRLCAVLCYWMCLQRTQD